VSAELLPCPFCGGEAMLSGARASCRRCLTLGPFEQYGQEDGQEDGSNWNRRTPAAPPEPCQRCKGKRTVICDECLNTAQTRAEYRRSRP